jgi:hypothetical protein
MPLKDDFVEGDSYTPAHVNAVAVAINTATADIITKQPSDADLTAIAALTPSNDDFVQRKSGAWTNRTPAQAKTDIGVATDIATAQTVTVNPQTGTTYTLVLTDANKAVECSNAAAITLTVPPNSSVAFPTGTVIEILQVGAGQVTLAAGIGVTLNTPSSLLARAQWSTLGLRKRATDSWIVTGDMV